MTMPRLLGSAAYASGVGSLSAAVGALALSARMLESPVLARVAAGYAPAQPETAFGLLACGLAVALTAGRRGRGLSRALGSTTLALAVAILVQHASRMTGLSTGQALVDAWLATPAFEPPMAPGTAIALALLGLALLGGSWLAAPAAVLGAIASALGASALLAYALGLDPAYGWGLFASMPPAVAGCIVLLGTAMASRRLGESTSGAFDAWRGPLLVGVGAAAVTVVLAQSLREEGQRQLVLLADAGAHRVRAEIRAGLDARVRGLSGLAREWEGRFLRMRSAWESDARLLLAQSPGMAAIEWIDADGQRDWVYPRDPAIAPADLGTVPRDGASIRARLVGPFSLPDGSSGLRLLVPLVESGEHRGWLSSIYASQAFFAEILSNLDLSYAVSVYAGGREIFRSEADPSGDEPLAQVGIVLHESGTELRVAVRPSAEMLAASRSPLVPMLLAGGLGMSGLLAMALGLRNVAAARARALAQEVGEHERAEEEVRRLNIELEDRVRRRTEDLSRSNRDLAQFASFLSHELRQPLGAQALWVDLLEAQLGSSLGEEERRPISEIRAATLRMSDLIDAQLELSAVSDAALQRAPIDLRALLGRAAADLKVELDGSGAVLQVGDLPIVNGDRRLLAQVFRNLLDNAIKYRRPGVPLEVRVYAREIHFRGETGAAIVVEDNGRGFAAEDEERIFEPSQRLDDDGNGHGLGLAICRRIAERHGGALRAEGREGRGARFELALPVGPSPGPCAATE
jgi:signal transduction histidine kinase